METKQDKGNALSLLAHKLARAVYCMLTRTTAFDLEQFLRPSGRRAGEPGASRDTEGMRLHRTDVQPRLAASLTAAVRLGPLSRSPARCWDTRSGSCIGGVGRSRLTCAAPPPSLSLTGELTMLSQPLE